VQSRCFGAQMIDSELTRAIVSAGVRGDEEMRLSACARYLALLVQSICWQPYIGMDSRRYATVGDELRHPRAPKPSTSSPGGGVRSRSTAGT
jgi:hypothetical protein